MRIVNTEQIRDSHITSCHAPKMPVIVYPTRKQQPHTTPHATKKDACREVRTELRARYRIQGEGCDL